MDVDELSRTANLAETVRFELTKGFPPRQFSRLLPSTARPRLPATNLASYPGDFGTALAEEPMPSPVSATARFACARHQNGRHVDRMGIDRFRRDRRPRRNDRQASWLVRPDRGRTRELRCARAGAALLRF